LQDPRKFVGDCDTRAWVVVANVRILFQCYKE
jgi:hypothetical protein